jgi:hypothetical protein
MSRFVTQKSMATLKKKGSLCWTALNGYELQAGQIPHLEKNITM